ncbi:two-pore potassium channel 1-like [Chenopodium quinoa]|uniref:two-pore potassium channel 1-like n=1 Tax=Chenopodium quinoa TaxID=63459 RepID=UPI000B7864A0|nr:two-pore potassium channel 1-like [Chenopodium quinoa]XP_021719829.1 two-pore potassium channel 1-like [Chenopodium quinoa]XP_021719830.1 two-pore potassium channel 1-like [Chenopodium quinoa]XP_021719831.1 two-pore potassium channel 1-like [Chenopodium quinoa]
MVPIDTAKSPLLERSVIKSAKKFGDVNKAFTRKRFRRSKSTPFTKYNPSKESIINIHNDDDPNPPPPSCSPNEKPVLLHVFLALALYLSAGTICFVLVRGQLDGKKTNGVVDALYFCIVTMTTVGYGDLVPATTLAKLLASLFVFSGVAVVGMILSRAAEYIVEKNEALVVKAFHLQEEAVPSAEILEMVPVETNRTRYKFVMASILLLSLMTAGTLFLTLHEEMDLIDAFYCVCATVTTLGYGDESFASAKSRLFAVFWILCSTMCLAQFFFYLTELYTERRQKTFLDWVLSRKLTLADIEEADLDNDNVVSAAEFVIMKLKEMEKITAEDVTVLMECFRNLDVDDSGTLTTADIINSG